MRARPIAVVLFSLIIIMIVGFAPLFSVLSSGPDSPTFLFTVAKRYEPLAWIRGADRFSSGANIFLQDASGRHPLIPGFAASADPTVSFDGKTVLFAGKQKAEDHWQIWEVALDATTSGGAPRRVTSCADDCVRPFYLPGYLPENRVVYAKETGGRFVVEAADRATGKTLQLTYAPGNFLPTDVLLDGRILLKRPTRSEPMARRNSTPSIPMAAEWSPIAAIMVKRVTPASRLHRVTSSSHLVPA